ncbi:uncharacterized protein ARMOST_16198 [Armillaria ostoyae]|uniref:Uncharacterized protein n=1 Tax=Armillaria ostoyae TaxID=47428 RepID=A0A284RVK7_ARMOS|nr:uncharacterized protein ARMOST_16198 [Armillaria ostoyae]
MPPAVQQILSQANQTWADMLETPLAPILPLFQLTALPPKIILDSDNDEPYQYHPHSPTLFEYEAFSTNPHINQPTSPTLGLGEHLNEAGAREAAARREYKRLTTQELQSSNRPTSILSMRTTLASSNKSWAQLSSCSPKTVASPWKGNKKPWSTFISSESTLEWSEMSITSSEFSSLISATKLAASYREKQMKHIDDNATGMLSGSYQQKGHGTLRSRPMSTMRTTEVSGHVTITDQTPTLCSLPLMSANISLMGIGQPMIMTSTNSDNSLMEEEISPSLSTMPSIRELPAIAQEIQETLEQEFTTIYTSRYMGLTLDLTWRTSPMAMGIL